MPKQHEKQELAELAGEFGSRIWANDDGTYLIARLKDGTIIKGQCSNAGEFMPGGNYRFFGVWKEHPQYGRQFDFQTFIQATPHTFSGVIEYLTRNCKRCGLGRSTAHHIVDLYGAKDAIATLKRFPEQVAAKIPRWSEENAKEARQLIAVEEFEQTKVDLMDLLAGRGFPGQLIEQCIDRFGIHAPERIKNDPFTLLVSRMSGCGFLRCNALYEEFGLPKDRLKRQMLCIWHQIVSDPDSTGSTWFEAKSLVERMRELVPGDTRVNKAIELGVRSGWLKVIKVEGQHWITTGDYARDESYLARRIIEVSAAV